MSANRQSRNLKLVPLFQNESKGETIVMKMTMICMKMNLQVNKFSYEWFRTQTQRQEGTRIRPINATYNIFSVTLQCKDVTCLVIAEAGGISSQISSPYESNGQKRNI